MTARPAPRRRRLAQLAAAAAVLAVTAGPATAATGAAPAATGPATSTSAASTPAARAAAASAAAPATDRAYLTIMVGRSVLNWVEGGATVPGVLGLFDVADQLRAVGLAATVPVVIAYTGDAAPLQVGPNTYPTWTQLAALRDGYGWHAADAGNYASLKRLSPTQVRAETCGTQPTLAARGFPEAWGLFAPAHDRSTGADRTIITSCFGFVRMYSPTGVTTRATAAPAWIARTRSVSGGSCADATAPCATVVPAAYTPPATLSACLAAGPGTWCTIQVYHLVVGDRSSGIAQWSCSDPDPRRHWTNKGEMYCLVDLMAALQSRPAGLVDADPATVALAWGRSAPA